jgi:transposase
LMEHISTVVVRCGVYSWGMSKKTDPEYLRHRMVELHDEGWRQKDIAQALGYTPEHVCRVLKLAREGGLTALKLKRSPGRPPRLDGEQLARLDLELAKGAEAHGFEGARWTSPRVALVVKRVFGVAFSHGHTCKILHKIGWSVQRPVRRSTRRSDEDVEIWRSERWEEIKKRPQRKTAKSSS